MPFASSMSSRARLHARRTRAAVADALRCDQGLSQDQLFAALPALDVQRVAESLNTLLSKVRARLSRQRTLELRIAVR